MSQAPISCVSKSSVLGVNVVGDLSWAAHIESIGKRAAQRIGSLYRSRRFLTRETCLHLYKSTIRPILEYCCHLWAGAPISRLSFLDRIQNRMRKLVGDELFGTLQPLGVRRDVACLSLFYRYYFGRCSVGLHDLMFPDQQVSRDTRRTLSSHRFCVQIPRCRTVSRSSSFFVRTAVLWNKLSSGCFPAGYDLASFKRRVNAHTRRPSDS